METHKKRGFEFTTMTLRKRKALDANNKTCSGCRICEVVCSLTHDREINPTKSRIFIRANPFKGSFVPQVCRHCSDAPCLQVCETSALQVRAEDGTVFIDEERCKGCRLCEKECSFGVIRFDPGRGKAFKCDFCKGDPQCIKWCPTHSLGMTEFGG